MTQSGYPPLPPEAPTRLVPPDADCGVADFLAAWRALLMEAIWSRELRFYEVATWLGLSKDEFGRRRRGEVDFEATHFFRLCRWFDLPRTPGELAGNEVAFTVPPHDDCFNAEAFVHGFGRLASLIPAGTLAPNDYEVAISTTDIPLARVLSDPTLAAVKLFFFRTCARPAGGPGNDYFVLAEERARLATIAQPLHAFAQAFERVDSREVWGATPLRSLCHQVCRLARERRIAREDTEAVFARVHTLVDSLETELLTGRKPGGGASRVYRDCAFAYLPFVALRTPEHHLGFVTYDPPDYLVPRGREGYDLIQHTVGRRVARADLVGNGGALPARTFASELREAIVKAAEIASTLHRANRHW